MTYPGAYLLGCFYIFVVVIASDESNVTNPKPVIKGQQYVRQTAVARLVGGPIPEDLLEMLQNNSTERVMTDSPIDPKKFPRLITDETKTTVTRMVIPLHSSYNSERYQMMLRKFLVQNRVNLTTTDPMESRSDEPSPFWLIGVKLYAANNLRTNMLSTLSSLLYDSSIQLPPNHHAPLAHIYRLLVLKRIPVIDLLDSLVNLTKCTPHDQWMRIFQELDQLVPPHMRSCITFLLESMQDQTLDFNKLVPFIKDKKVNLLCDIPTKNSFTWFNKPILYPKKTLIKIKNIHEDAIGRTMSAMMVAALESNMSPRMFVSFLQHLPGNTPNPIFDEMARSIIHSEPVKVNEGELLAVAEASVNGFNPEQTPTQIFKNILQKIVQYKFEGVEIYKVLLEELQMPSETYVITNFEIMAPLIMSKKALTLDLLNAAVKNSSKNVLTVKNTLAKLIENGYFEHLSVPYYKIFADSPSQLIQLVLLYIRNNEEIANSIESEIKVLEAYLNEAYT